jgi:hypothetical protein
MGSAAARWVDCVADSLREEHPLLAIQAQSGGKAVSLTIIKPSRQTGRSCIHRRQNQQRADIDTPRNMMSKPSSRTTMASTSSTARFVIANNTTRFMRCKRSVLPGLLAYVLAPDSWGIPFSRAPQ